MNVQVYEALKDAIGAENATVVANALPPAGDLPTKHDFTGAIAGVKAEIAEFRADMREAFATARGELIAGEERLRAEIRSEGTRYRRWTLALFIPAWVGTWGTLVALLLRSRPL